MNAKRTPRTAYSYLRFSSAKQAKGDSARRQTAFAESASAANGWSLDTSLSLQDKGVSAFKGKNLELGRLGAFIKAIEEGTVRPGSVLIVEALDRLSRDVVSEASSLLVRIVKLGVDVFVSKPAEKLYTKENINDLGTFLEIVVAFALANQESEKRSFRATAKRHAMREAQTKTAACPGWLRLNKKENKYEFIPERKKVIDLIWKLALGKDGKPLGMAAICQELNAKGFKTFRNGEIWHFNTVRRILVDRTVLGEYQPHKGTGSERKPFGERIEGYYPPVVSLEDFEKVQTLIQGRTHKGKKTTGDIQNYFQGLWTTADGSPVSLNYSSHKGKRYYYLVPYQSKLNGIHGDSYPFELLQADCVRALALSWDQLFPQADRPDASSEVLAKLGALRAKLAKLSDIQDSDPSVATGKLLAKCEGDIREAQTELDQIKINSSGLSKGNNFFAEIQERGGIDYLDSRYASLVAQLVESVVLEIEVENRYKKSCVATINLKSGKRLEVRSHTGRKFFKLLDSQPDAFRFLTSK